MSEKEQETLTAAEQYNGMKGGSEAAGWTTQFIFMSISIVLNAISYHSFIKDKSLKRMEVMRK